MKKAVRDAIADIIKMEGVEYVFGHTGGHIMLLWDAISKAGVKTVFNKQEGNAIYMADSYSKLSGKPTIVLGTSGPGIQNAVTGLASAYLDSVPVIAIGAGVATTAAGRNALQESSGRGRAADQLSIFKGITKQASLAQTPQAVPRLIREAFRTAVTGRPGPVYIEIPSDFWTIEIDYEKVDPDKYKNGNQPECNIGDCLSIADALYQAEKPVFVIGEGALEPGIGKKLMDFISNVQIPFFVSPKAKDFCDEYHPFYISALRCHRKVPKEYGYFLEADLIVFLGDRMNQWEFDWDYSEEVFGKAKLAQIDPDSNEIGRVYEMDYSAVGSISSFIDSFEPKAHKNAKKLKSMARKYNFKLHRPRKLADGDGINPLNLNNTTEDLAPESSIIVADTAYTGSMAINKFRTKFNQRFINSDYNSPMGYALPAAIGATFYSDNPVICLIGDGSFQMTMNELGTLMNYKRRVIFIIEDNGGCISIKNNMDGFYGVNDYNCMVMFDNPDFAKIAQAYCMEGITVKSGGEYRTALDKALNSSKSWIIDAKIDQKLMDWE